MPPVLSGSSDYYFCVDLRTLGKDTLYGSERISLDTDGDGYGDGQEIALLSDPLNPSSTPQFASF